MNSATARVLIVEDDHAQRTTLCDMVRQAGFEAVPCADGAGAVERVAKDHFPVAIVDYRLPDLSGIEVLEKIRNAGSVRVIMHTAFGSFESAKEAVNLGAFAFVEKAGDPELLLREVRRAVDESIAELVWELEGCLGAITEYAPDLILQIDREGTITFSNRGLDGHAPGEVLGTRLEEWVEHDHRDRLRRAVQRVFRDGAVQGCRVMVQDESGNRRWCDCRLGPVMSGTDVARAIVIARDVTEENRTRIADGLVQHLVRNAREAIGETGNVYIETGHVVLDEQHVRDNPGARTGPHLMISVRDSGGGMTPEAMDRVFEPWYTTKRDDGCVGLGLTRVYGLVAEAGGHIVVESEPECGTTFRVFLPLPS